VQTKPRFVHGFVLLVMVLAARPGHAEVPPDGWILWQSTRLDSQQDTYRARADGSEVTRMTTQGTHMAQWSPDGRWIAFSDETGVSLMRPDGSEVQPISAGAGLAFWLHDDSGVVVESPGGTFVLIDPDTKEHATLFQSSDFPAFAGTSFQPNSMTHDNRYLLLGSHLYGNGYTGANGSFKSEYSALVIDLAAKDRVYFFGTGCWPFTPPDGDLIFHVCGENGGCPTFPDIYRLHLADLDSRSSYQAEMAHPDPDWGHEYNPRISTDGKWMTYMATTGCHAGGCDYEIFLHRLGAGSDDRARVTESPTFDGYPHMYVGPFWQKSPGPRLVLTPSQLTFTATGAAAPEPRSIKIKNDGGGTLGTVHASVDPPVPWLAVAVVDGALTVRVLADHGLSRGSQRATVSAALDGSTSPPLTVPVTVLADDSFPAPSPPDAAATDAAPGSAAPSSSSSSGGCHCSSGARGRIPAGPVLVLGVALAALRRRQRSRH